MKRRIYLAGPEVFLRDAEAVFQAKREICRRYGFQGVSPLESHLDAEPIPQSQWGWRISRSNEACMRSCDLAIGNLTPFRSPSADPGTAYELGFMRALGKPVLGYTNVGGTLRERTALHFGGQLRARDSGGQEDPEGLLVEDFELVDNLMLDGAILSSGAQLVVVAAPPAAKFTYLAGFEKCVQQAARLMLKPEMKDRSPDGESVAVLPAGPAGNGRVSGGLAATGPSQSAISFPAACRTGPLPFPRPPAGVGPAPTQPTESAD